MMWVIRFILLILFLFLIYRIIKFLFNPKRKLELACDQKKYYLYDDPHNVRKNFLLTYKGVIFEGEKYLGTTKDSFDVISILIWPQALPSLKGFVRDDFYDLERKINEHYQNAKIEWKSPIKEFLHQKNPSETPK